MTSKVNKSNTIRVLEELSELVTQGTGMRNYIAKFGNSRLQLTQLSRSIHLSAAQTRTILCGID